MCDCAGDIDLLEESKVSERSLLVAGGVYEKSFSLMSFCYTSENKVNELESNIHDLYKVARDNFKMVNEFKLKYYECKEKLNQLQANHEILDEEFKSHLSQWEEHKQLKESMSVENLISSRIKFKIEDVLDLGRSEKNMSTLLEEVFESIDVFVPKKHFILMDILEEEIRVLCKQEGKYNLNEQELMELKESLIDFLYRLKDKHPFSNSEEENTMDVFYRVMKFMEDNNLYPSHKLQEEYRESETTKSLNDFPSFVSIKDKIGIRREVYDKMKERYLLQPTFVYFFNPDIEIQIDVGESTKGQKLINIGFVHKGEWSMIGAGMRIFDDGELQQAYFKDNNRDFYGRCFYSNGNYYIGGYRQSKKHGKGMIIWKDGSKEVGQWNHNIKIGAFKYYDIKGKEHDKFYQYNENIPH